jgi:hypothetical protein
MSGRRRRRNKVSRSVRQEDHIRTNGRQRLQMRCWELFGATHGDGEGSEGHLTREE